MNPIELSSDTQAILQVIADESSAFWNKNFAAWAQCWRHTADVRLMGWWALGGLTVIEGWEALSHTMKTLMAANPAPNPTAAQVRRENMNLHIHSGMAWVTFDQYGQDTGETAMDMPGLSHETRVLEKEQDVWKIVYVNWLLEGGAGGDKGS